MHAIEAREVMRAYLDEHTVNVPGSITQMHRFVRAFIPYADVEYGPAASLWWCQQSRVRRVLHDLGYPVGYFDLDYSDIFGIGNLSMAGSKAVCPVELVLQADAPGMDACYLVPIS